MTMTDKIETRTVHLVDDRRMGGVSRFLERLLELRPDDEIVHVPRKTLRARKYQATTIVSHLAVSWRSLPMLIALRACNPSARLVHVEHSYSGGFQQHRVPKTARFHTLLRTVYALFDQVAAVSDGQAGWMRTIDVVPAPKLLVAPPIVDLDPFLSLAAPTFEGPVRYGFVGRIDEQKGLDVALKAWAMIAPKNATLDIYGDGPTREALQASVAGISSVRFHGSTNDPAQAYESFDIAIMPSRWEPYGLSCLEARAAGRAVIVADVDGLPEQVARGGGLVVDASLPTWLQIFSRDVDKLSIFSTADGARRSALQDQARAVEAWQELLKLDDLDGTIETDEAVADTAVAT